MRNELLTYYNRELTFIRKLAIEYAEDHPDVAARLRISPQSGEGTDPHVERMISAFAFLTARIRQKLDDDFPELAHALLGVLYPHYLAPIPSMAIVEFQLDRGQAGLADGYPVGTGQVLETEPVDGESCTYRTCYPVRVWPIEIVEASLGRIPASPGVAKDVNALLRIRLKCFAKDMTFGQLSLESLRFYLNGQAQHVFALYELIFNHLTEVRVTAQENSAKSEPLDLRVVGFDAAEAVLPFGARSFPGYRILAEYFAFPQKFCFFELSGLTDQVRSKLGNEVEICLYLDCPTPDWAANVSSSTFRLGCTPVVNLFKLIADPIPLSHQESEYRVVPDRRRPGASCEVYSIAKVTAISPRGDSVAYEPFYSLKHAAKPGAEAKRFWLANRRPSSRSEHDVSQGTEVYLSVVDLAFNPSSPADWTLEIETECLNRDLPEHLPPGGGHPRFQLTDGGPVAIVPLTPPTPTRRPSLGPGTLWRIISHLSLNHLSITGSGESTDALKEILKLYDYTDSPETQSRIDKGIVKVSSSRVTGRVKGDPAGGVCRGVRVEIEFDEERFTDRGLFLFATVLERFLGLYAAVNSFTQLSITSKQRPRILRLWPPRSNHLILP
jgi:type VI secretion system protein ImpG